MPNRYYEYLEQIKKNHISITKLEWLNPDGTVAFDISQDVIQDGTLSVTYQNGMRRTADITINNWDNIYDVNVNKIWFGQQIRLSCGLILPDGYEYYLPQGVFYVSNPISYIAPTQKTIKLNLVDKWAYLDGTLFGKIEGIYQLNVGDNLFTAIEQILRKDRGNGLPIDSVPPLLSSYYIGKTVHYNDEDIPILDCPYTFRLESGSSYADLLTEIATMLVGEIGYDKTGTLRLESVQTDVADTAREVLWNYNTHESELLSYNIESKTSEVFNDIVITGAVINGAIAKGRATNTDIRSPTSIYHIGRKTKYEEQSKYYSNDQCQELAEYYLKKYQGLKETITIASIPMFHFTENALITLSKDNGTSRTPYIVNSYTLPLAQIGTMTITATSIA